MKFIDPVQQVALVVNSDYIALLSYADVVDWVIGFEEELDPPFKPTCEVREVLSEHDLVPLDLAISLHLNSIKFDVASIVLLFDL